MHECYDFSTMVLLCYRNYENRVLVILSDSIYLKLKIKIGLECQTDYFSSIYIGGLEGTINAINELYSVAKDNVRN